MMMTVPLQRTSWSFISISFEVPARLAMDQGFR
jgi:hypothetical protein